MDWSDQKTSQSSPSAASSHPSCFLTDRTATAEALVKNVEHEATYALAPRQSQGAVADNKQGLSALKANVKQKRQQQG